jgi:hypothetical protein
MSREDAMALSRLYAVQLLAGLCQDFMAAAAWLEAGGAGLSHEQQEVRPAAAAELVLLFCWGCMWVVWFVCCTCCALCVLLMVVCGGGPEP